MARKQNTWAKRQRELKTKRKAEEKRARRHGKKDGPPDLNDLRTIGPFGIVIRGPRTRGPVAAEADKKTEEGAGNEEAGADDVESTGEANDASPEATTAEKRKGPSE